MTPDHTPPQPARSPARLRGRSTARLTAVVVGVSAWLSGCALVPAGGLDDAVQSIGNQSDSVARVPSLPAAARPAWRPGDVFVFGRSTVRRIVSGQGDRWVWQTTDGQSYTTTGHFFVPIVDQTLPGRHIRSRIEGRPETLWPLQTGRSVEFTEHRHQKQTVFGIEQTVVQRWRCEVVDTRYVSVPAGDFEAFHVRCAARSVSTGLPGQIMTWDYAPAIGHYVQRTWYEGGRVRQSVLSAALPGELATEARLQAVLLRLQND